MDDKNVVGVCHGSVTCTPVVSGGPTSTMQKATNMASSMLQSFRPLDRICQHVCAFHVYAHDSCRQVRAHHFCSMVNEDFRQCVIYDSDKADARLIGIEYIISRKLFEQLPAEERRFWHSHVYEVQSGMLALPGVPVVAETMEAKKLIDTYGKTWHTWQVDRGDILPLGPAQLMMSFTGDGQLHPQTVDTRNALDEAKPMDELRAARVDLEPEAPPHPDADHPWHTGKAWQVNMEQVDFKDATKVAGEPASA